VEWRRSCTSVPLPQGTVHQKYFPLMDIYHGVNNSPKTYQFEIHCKRVLIPFNLIWSTRTGYKESWVEYVKKLYEHGVEVILDSGAAAFHINAAKKRAAGKQVGYPEGYLKAYLNFIKVVEPYITFAFALDTCYESEEFQNIPDFIANLIRQEKTIIEAKDRGIKIPIYPVVQGWNRTSYRYSARFTQALMNKYDLNRFGIGSVCRAKAYPTDKGKGPSVYEVMFWLQDVIDLTFAHAFGQTQRTIVILLDFSIKSLDTSNATANAARFSYCDPAGNWFYSQVSNQGSRKHNFENGFSLDVELRNFMFYLNVESLELSCYNEIPNLWVHPVENYVLI